MQKQNSLIDINDEIEDNLLVEWNDARPLEPKKTFYLDGNSLTDVDLCRLRLGLVKIDLTKEAWDRIDKSRKVVENIVATGKVAYGISTGFGKFANIFIKPEFTEALQENLIRSHSCGVGRPLSIRRARMLMALRINVLAKGYSGISSETLARYIAAFNKDCIPQVPEKGTVGASGDLAPLSHLALGMLGEGMMWDPEKDDWYPAKNVLEKYGLQTIKLRSKEGLALINGTQFITAIGAECIIRCLNLVRTADVAAALTLETLKGTYKAFDSRIHNARPHKGQIQCANRLRALLHSEEHPSKIYLSHINCDRVQDSYTLRCIPQVHGIVWDTIKFARRIINTEINSATDNPMIFSETGDVISGGNFHGEYPAKALDYLCIGIQEIANISERRIERLNNPDLSGLPAFLVNEGGLNSGFMIAHCTAAALTSENKVLCHPASCDTLSTSAAKEDHVSMGGFAARKCLEVINNVEIVVGIELLCACQGIDLLRDMHPGEDLSTTAPLEAVMKKIRSVVPKWEKDRYMKPDLDAVHSLVCEGSIWAAAYRLIYKIVKSEDKFIKERELLEKEGELPGEESDLEDEPTVPLESLQDYHDTCRFTKLT